MKEQVRSVLFMFLLALFFASLVSAVRVLNAKKLETNRVFKLQKAVLKVLDIGTDKKMSGEDVSRLFQSRVKNIELGERSLYAGYKEDENTLQGYAFPVSGPGFWGPIYGMVGINPDATKVLGIAFLKHSETPGLGGRITEDWFMDQFKDLPLHPIKGGRNIFTLTPPGTAKGPGRLDTITGATNTSAAVESFLNRELDLFLKEFRSTVKKR